MPRKILISPGFGAGWSSWGSSNEEKRDFSLTYQPLIDAIEKHHGVTNSSDFDKALAQFHQDLEDKFEDSHFYDGGAEQLEVVEVDCPFIVEEYDGSESLRFKEADYWIDPDSLP